MSLSVIGGAIKLIWPFLKEIIFGKGDVTESIKTNWIAWSMFFINIFMLCMMLFLADQVIEQLRSVNAKKKEIAVLTAKLKAITPHGVSNSQEAAAVLDELKRTRQQLQNSEKAQNGLLVENSVLKHQIETLTMHGGREKPRVVTTVKKPKRKVPVPAPTLSEPSLRDKLNRLD